MNVVCHEILEISAIDARMTSEDAVDTIGVPV